MRDDGRNWDALPKAFPDLAAQGVEIRQVRMDRQTLISGPGVLKQMEASWGKPRGWPEVVDTERYVLALRRDRVLLANGPGFSDGWDPQNNQAVSDVSDAYRVFEIEGTGALAFLRRGGDVSLKKPSASVARPMFGCPTVLYRVRNEVSFRLHVPLSNASAAWRWFEQVAVG